MRTAIVPAQVTTVEFKVAGNLGVTQFCLLLFAIFCSGLVYALVPPLTHGTVPKVILITTICAICGILSLRVNGRVVLAWIGIYYKYYFHPKYYVFDKRTSFARYKPTNIVRPKSEIIPDVPAKLHHVPTLTTAEIVHVEQLMDNPDTNLKFKNKKGKLYVHITDIRNKEQLS
jgi:hypothetical protein